MENNKAAYQLEFMVRDYELDLQGIVNNAHYQHYLEHARHEFLFESGIDFAALHNEGIDLVVTRIEMDYKQALVSRDKFVVTINVVKDGHLKMVFEQKILRMPDLKPVVLAKVTGVCLRKGRPVKPEDVFDIRKLTGTSV
jgi:acyl-CoA thioester hydrolase